MLQARGVNLFLHLHSCTTKVKQRHETNRFRDKIHLFSSTEQQQKQQTDLVDTTEDADICVFLFPGSSTIRINSRRNSWQRNCSVSVALNNKKEQQQQQTDLDTWTQNNAHFVFSCSQHKIHLLSSTKHSNNKQI